MGRVVEEGAPLVAEAGQASVVADPLRPGGDGSSRPAAGEVETFMVRLHGGLHPLETSAHFWSVLMGI